MQYKRYDDVRQFRREVMPVLLEDEAKNNLILSLLTNAADAGGSDWLYATVSSGGNVALTALWVKPFDLLLYETGSVRNDDTVAILAREMRKTGYDLPGVTADSEPARMFAGLYCGGGTYHLHMKTITMKLDKPALCDKAPGSCRMLQPHDLTFVPYWEQAFSRDCRAHVFTVRENTQRLKTQLGKDIHFIWEDGVPVAQAVNGRDTPNGAVINHVYTPPAFRGHGYAKSVVAELSNTLLDRGRAFCCLIADAANDVSCGLYHKLGYYDVCIQESIKFDNHGRIA